MDVREEIEQREENAGGLLHAEKAPEWPFAVELNDRFEVGRFAREALLSYDVLAGIVAFLRACPE